MSVDVVAPSGVVQWEGTKVTTKLHMFSMDFILNYLFLSDDNIQNFLKSCGIVGVNTLAISDAIWHHRPWSTLLQVMACHLFGAKPLLVAMLAYNKFDTWEQTSMRFESHWFRSVSTHWGRVTHTCVSKLIIIGSDNGLLPGRHHAITWTNTGILLIGPLGANFSEILVEIHKSLFKKTHLKMSSAKCRPSCLSLNVLKVWRMVCFCHGYVECNNPI